jgi:hypothetical protein
MKYAVFVFLFSAIGVTAQAENCSEVEACLKAGPKNARFCSSYARRKLTLISRLMPAVIMSDAFAAHIKRLPSKLPPLIHGSKLLTHLPSKLLCQLREGFESETGRASC